MRNHYDRDEFTGGGQRKPDKNKKWYTWPIIIVLFSLGIWPIALILLLFTLFDDEKNSAGNSRNLQERYAGESAVERAMRLAGERAEEAARAASDMAARVERAAERTPGRRLTPDEMAQILNDALDRAKAQAAKERERMAAQAQRQSAPPRTGYADARPDSRPQPSPKPVQEQQPKKQKKQKIPGKGLRVWGTILMVFGAIIGLSFLGELLDGYGYLSFDDFFASLGFLAGGGIMFGRGQYLGNMTRRSQRYILAIGNVDAMPLTEIAKRVNRKPAQAAKELQKLIDKGYLGEDAYIDKERGYFLRFGATLEDEPQERQAEEFVPPPEEEGYGDVLRNIRKANQRIADPELSRKIARIEQVTGLILKEVEEHPEKRDRIHTFFDYYLPTTQKLLDTYADFEATGVEGANLRQAKARIAETMDAVVAGFERQLDHLYSADALDVVTDIQVLEAMLNRDGATASQDFGYHDDGKKDDDEGGFRPLQL